MLEDDLRHSERNEAASERAANQLRPVVRRLVGELLEMDDDELLNWRDAMKSHMRQVARREERKNDSIKEIIKWAVGATAGAALGWIASHWGGK